jgi:hypothetical protein
VPVNDLNVLPKSLRASARRDPNGEVSWHRDDAPVVVDALAAAGRVVLGLDVRDYDADGKFVEIAWSAYEGQDVIAARDTALSALARNNLPGEWVLITW